MQITLLFFAAARDATGCAKDAVELPEGVTAIGDLSGWLGLRYPKLEPYLGCLRFAQNEQFVSADAKLADCDVIAIIPPVAGG